MKKLVLVRHARRIWSISENPELRYCWLLDFDRDLINLVRENRLLEDLWIPLVKENPYDQVLAYRRKEYIFIFNFNPFKSFEGYGFPMEPSKFKIVLNTDAHGWFFGLGARHNTIYTDRKIEKRNGRNAFFAKDGDTYENIAIELAMNEEEILKYNDCEKGSEPDMNSLVYLQKKKGRAPRGNDYHIAKENESLWSIAQWYGVRLNSLYRLNKMKQGQEPHPGQIISLRKRI